MLERGDGLVLRHAQHRGQVRNVRLLSGGGGGVLRFVGLHGTHFLRALLLLGLLRRDQLAFLEPLPCEVSQRADQQDQQHHDGDEHAAHAPRFALIGGDLLLLLLFLLLLSVTPLGLLGLRGYGIVAEQERRSVNRLKSLDGIRVLVVVVAPVAETAGMRAVAHRGERLGQADALVRSVDGRLRVAHGREGLGEADALVGAVGGGAFGYVGSMFGHR